MPSLQQLRRRLKSVKSIHQITRAMEMVATSKMKMATKKAILARNYSNAIEEILSSLTNGTHLLMQKNELKNIAIIFITSDRGLCGGFNSSLLRKLCQFTEEQKEKNISIITVGKKGREFVLKLFKDCIVADFTEIKDEILYEETTPIAHFLTESFKDKKYSNVYIVYSHYISSFNQEPTIVQLLPVTKTKNDVQNIEYLIEPTRKEILDDLVSLFIEIKIFQSLLESKASEYSARMVAMRNATENAKDLMDELYLTYHSLRQTTITSELIEMATAKKAMEDE